ncbi:MAG: hypothetical protein ACK417_01505 [Bacteroidia bacterium]
MIEPNSGWEQLVEDIQVQAVANPHSQLLVTLFIPFHPKACGSLFLAFNAVLWFNAE